MNRELHIDRIIVHGVQSTLPDAATLRPLLETAVRQACAEAAWPRGRSAHSTLALPSPAIQGAPAIAQAVAAGVRQGLRTGGRHG